MARQLTMPGHARGKGILRVLERKGDSFTTFATRTGLNFKVWYRLVHHEGDPDANALILVKALDGGMPLNLIAPTLAKALVAAGWRPPTTSDSAA